MEAKNGNLQVMSLMKLLTGTLIIALLTLGCNAEEPDSPDAADREPLELEDVQNEIEDPDVLEQVPLEPEDPDPDTVVYDPETENNAGPESQEINRETERQPGQEHAGRAAASAESGNAVAGDADRTGQDNERQPVVIPPEVINPDFSALLNEDNELIVSGRSVDELLELIGEPPHMLRQGHRGSGWHKEVWILPIYQEDSTGLYIYIQNGQVSDWRLDTFVGVGNHPQLL